MKSLIESLNEGIMDRAYQKRHDRITARKVKKNDEGMLMKNNILFFESRGGGLFTLPKRKNPYIKKGFGEYCGVSDGRNSKEGNLAFWSIDFDDEKKGFEFISAYILVKKVDVKDEVICCDIMGINAENIYMYYENAAIDMKVFNYVASYIEKINDKLYYKKIFKAFDELNYYINEIAPKDPGGDILYDEPKFISSFQVFYPEVEDYDEDEDYDDEDW